MPEADSAESSYVGKSIGPYHIEAEIGQGRWGRIYRALQSSVNRTVAVKILSPEIAALAGKAEQFLEESRAAAQITHPNIAAIYEAGHRDGAHYCAMEYMDGPVLKKFLLKDGVANEHHLLHTIAGIARALDFLWQRQIPHRSPAATNIFVDSVGNVKLIEIVAVPDVASRSPRDDMIALGVVLAQIVNDAGVLPAVGELIERMVGTEGRRPFASPAELAETAEALDLQLFPPPPPAEPTIGKIQPKKTRPIVLIASAAVGLIVAGIVVAFVVQSGKPPPQPPPIPKDFDTMVEVPAGEFIYQDDQKKSLPAPFLIDRYEVTIRQYKKFIDAIAAGYKPEPHVHEPGKKDYRPENWDAMLQAVMQNATFVVGDTELRLYWDSPVIFVDWYDAYQYAAWRAKQEGKPIRLPTDVEWERSARGTDGRLYPWGNQLDTTLCNCATSGKKPMWTHVYAFLQDRSPTGAIGMAGSASEWATFVEAPSIPAAPADKKSKSSKTSTPPLVKTSPVIRGGSWRDADPRVTLRQLDPQQGKTRSVTVGFRCAANAKP